jgi:hypothetical protein
VLDTRPVYRLSLLSINDKEAAMGATAELPDTDRARRRLTQPLGGLLYFFAVFVAGIVFIALGSLAFGSQDMSILGVGRGPACVDVYTNGVTMTSTDPTIVGLRPGASSGIEGTIPVCVMHPTASQRALEILSTAPGPVLDLAIVLLVLQLLVVIRRLGPFVVPVVSRLRFLAWFLLIGSVAATVTQNIAAAEFLATAVNQSVPVASDALNVSTLATPLLVACALLTLARILRAGVRMQDDLAGTV